MYHSQNLSSLGVILRNSCNGLVACMSFASGSGGSARRPTVSRTISHVAGMCMPLLAVMLLVLVLSALSSALTGGALHAATLSSPAVLVFAGPVATKKSDTPSKKPAAIREMEANLKALSKELEAGQLEMAAGPISPARGEELEEKAKEMEELQAHLDQYNRIAGTLRSSREVEKITLPEEKSDSRIIRTTPGHLFVASDAFRRYRTEGKQGWSSNVEMKTRLGKRIISLRGQEAKAFEQKAFDAATLSDLGEDAIVQVDRDSELVRFEEPEILTIRDILNNVPTTSDAIRYVRHVLTVRAADSQASRGAAKEYLHMDFEPVTTSVETIAVLAKVTEQDIDDAPRLIGYINGEMGLDIKVQEEQQLAWGDGLNGHLKGLFHADNAIPEFDRAGVEDTVIDTIRRMRTDLRKKKVTPNFVTVDPLDWEEIELAKGSDERYIWGLITDLRGPRIWSLRVVESDAMTHPTTNERRILVGDGVRGATVYDRNETRFAIGFVDDDFRRNLRTLRAEERVALAVKRSFAFTYAKTAEAES